MVDLARVQACKRLQLVTLQRAGLAEPPIATDVTRLGERSFWKLVALANGWPWVGRLGSTVWVGVYGASAVAFVSEECDCGKRVAVPQVAPLWDHPQLS